MNMNFKLKTLLVLSGAALLTVPALHAQRGGARAGLAARPAASAGGLSRGSRFTNARGSYFNRGTFAHGNGHHHYGRYYYLSGIPYYYPFYGYGYPGFYGGFYGDGFFGPYGSGYYAGGYEGRLNGRDHESDRDNDGRHEAVSADGSSLPSAVQRQLAKRGYYKGKVDGQFGPGSRDALSRFQKSQDIKPTGRIDEDTLEALGFTDQR